MCGARRAAFRPIATLAALLMLSGAGSGGALAQGPMDGADAGLPQITSSGPDAISLTVYRAPSGAGDLNLRSLSGFAMISEQRNIHIPKGRSVLRFEGVAGSILSVSAVIEGLPGGTIEKNRDVRLLSPASLVDGSLGQRVTLTRTNPATGVTESEQASIMSGPERGVILSTSRGIEALRCSGLPEGLQYSGVPAGLSREPVLSVVTDSPTAQDVTVTLSYLASEFDWRASYVATLAPDGGSLNLFAWLSLGNGNQQSFAEAEVMAVAGRINRQFTPRIWQEIGALRLTCYPLGTTTSNLKKQQQNAIFLGAARYQEDVLMRAPMPAMAAPAPPAPPPPPPPPEDLGDLKLYRVPERVDVAANGQKQVALLRREGVKFSRLYRATLPAGAAVEPSATQISLALRNEKASGLGLALPMGGTALYQPTKDGQILLVGRGDMKDRAEGERFDIAAGSSHQVTVEQRRLSDTQAIITIRNANVFPVDAAIRIGQAGQKIRAKGAKLRQEDGVMLWEKQLRGGQSATLQYDYDDGR